MDLNLFEGLKKEIESNNPIKNFMGELSEFLNNDKSKIGNNNISPNHFTQDELNEHEKRVQNYRKEGHLYFVTEGRNNTVWLWDFTDKPKFEFEEWNFSEDLLKVATEGAMLQYNNGKYELYSDEGYDMVLGNK